jgi:hypothetical protein
MALRLVLLPAMQIARVILTVMDRPTICVEKFAFFCYPVTLRPGAPCKHEAL